MSGILTNVLTGGATGAVSAVAALATEILKRVVDDPAAQDAMAIRLAELEHSGVLAQLAQDTGVMQAQAATNTAEAASASLFVAGWRPAVGWICAVGLGVQYGLAPVLTWLVTLAGRPVAFPQLNMSDLFPLLFGMLGIGVMRSWEKTQGVARDRL
tara:strand:- start:4855 stop:5322 length:468 start_codon:yes stop_codon:yes gene_type:complete